MNASPKKAFNTLLKPFGITVGLATYMSNEFTCIKVIVVTRVDLSKLTSCPPDKPSL